MLEECQEVCLNLNIAGGESRYNGELIRGFVFILCQSYASDAVNVPQVDFGEVFEAGEGFVDVIGLSIVASLELYEVKKWKGKWSTFRGTRLGAISFTNIGNHCQRSCVVDSVARRRLRALVFWIE